MDKALRSGLPRPVVGLQAAPTQAEAANLEHAEPATASWAPGRRRITTSVLVKECHLVDFAQGGDTRADLAKAGFAEESHSLALGGALDF
jgi:hypothetical protein